MTMPDIRLKSVNWTTGMLLTPGHFEAQDRYIDGMTAWLLRYCVPATGLIGGGVRVGGGERGLARHDPKLDVHDDGGPTLRVTVSEARGITPAGEIVDVSPADLVRAEIPRADLAGLTEAVVYVLHTGEREEDPGSAGADVVNPNAAALRRPRHELVLGIHADLASHALVVGKIRRAAATLAFERDDHFIPPCASLVACSSLAAAWDRLRNEVAMLAGDFADLHRRAARYASQIVRRGVDTGGDRDVLDFLERAVVALDACAHELADPTQSPRRAFQQIERAGRTAALALDLSTTTQLYLELLASIDNSYAALLSEKRLLLGVGREAPAHEDLSASIDRAEHTLARLRQLREVLSAKYVDYRVNRWVDTLRFLLDKDGEHFYTAVTTPGHPQRDGDLLTFVFSQLNLTGRQEYRVVLLGDAMGAPTWQPGDQLHVELRINAGNTPGLPTVHDVRCELMGQRNFAVNFDTPSELTAITNLQVTVEPGQRVRGAILFQRRRGLVDDRSLHAVPPAPAAPPLAGPVIKIRATSAL